MASACYVYAILARETPLPAGLRGFDGAAVALVPYRALAAATSPLEHGPPRPSPQNLWRHEAVVEALLAQLERVEGCDEWAVHVYANHPAIAQRVTAEHPTIRQLQHELATAHPGRAYFLQRELDEERAAATDQALRELAQAAYDRLARWAEAGQVTLPARSTPAAHGEIEILRAAFLVPRANADTFLAEVRSCVESRDGVHCEYSGPWAPYSFAVPTEEEKP